MVRTGPKPRVISGVIEEVEFQGLRQSGKVSQMKFRLVPTFARLMLVSGFRIFQKKTVPEIMHQKLETGAAVPKNVHRINDPSKDDGPGISNIPTAPGPVYTLKEKIAFAPAVFDAVKVDSGDA